MATVKISGALLDHTKNIIENMQRKEASEVDAVSNVITIAPDDPRIINRFIPPEHLSTYMTMPKKWMEEHRRLEGVLRYQLKPDSPDTGADVHFNVEFTNGASCFLPMTTYHRYGSDGKLNIVHAEGRWPELDALVNKLRHDRECRNRWNDVKQKVIEFLNTFSTLNQAVKQWPGVKLYIDRQYLDRLEQKVERSSGDVPAAPTMNYDELTAAAVAHRMTI